MAGVEYATMTVDDLRAELERIATEMGTSLDELIARYQRGELDETEGPWHLAPYLRLYLSAVNGQSAGR